MLTTGEGQKVPPEAVNFGPSNDLVARCSNCWMYQDGSCAYVAGIIGPSSVCDAFVPAQERLATR